MRTKYTYVAVALIVLNLFILYLRGLSGVQNTLPVQGLVLNVTGAVVIALPDIPQLERYSTPSKLRNARDCLEKEGEIRSHQNGFDEIIDLIDEHTPRIPRDRRIQVIRTGHEPYGNPHLLAGFDDDPDNKPPKYWLTRWVTLSQWISEEQDKIRTEGMVILLLGFTLQLLGILIA